MGNEIIAGLDDLAKKIRNAIQRQDSSRVEWIEASLDLCMHLFEARRRIGNNILFGEWCNEQQFGLNHQTQAAAIAMGEQPDNALLLLTDTKRESLDTIYNKEFKHRFTNVRKTSPTSVTPPAPSIPEPPINIILDVPPPAPPPPPSTKPKAAPIPTILPPITPTAPPVAKDKPASPAPTPPPPAPKRTTIEQILTYYGLPLDTFGKDNPKITLRVSEVAIQLLNGIAESRGTALTHLIYEALSSLLVPAKPFMPLALTAQQKLDSTIKQYKAKIDLILEYTIRERVTKYVDEVLKPLYAKKAEEADKIIKARKGLMRKADYRKIIACLHPDNMEGDPRQERYKEAFILMRQLELVFLNEEELKADEAFANILKEAFGSKIAT